MARKKVADVDHTSMAHNQMMIRWQKINSLLGGTEAMRNAGETFLPKHAEEDHENWSKRIQRSVLTNVFKRTARSLSGRPFTEDIKLNNMPAPLEALAEDIDKQGNNLNIFSREVFQEGISHGFSGILVDFPPVTELNEDGSMRTLADEIREGITPYFVQIHPENIIAGFSTVVNGVEMLTHVRIREDTVVQEGWEERTVERIRVLEPGLWVLWEKIAISSRKEEWQIVASGETSLAFIPLVIFYTDRQGVFMAEPPMIDIANLNIAHWQSASDQRHILTVARFPILASSGVVDPGTTVIGPNEHLNTPDTQGRFYYVEHGGAAIGAGRQDMEDLKEEMVVLAMEPLLRKSGNVTATQRAIDAAEAHSELQAMAMKFSEVLTIAFAMAGLWINVKMNEDSEVIVFTEFGPSAQESKDIDQLISMRAQGDISRESFYTELMRRSFLDINFDPATEERKIEEEAPNLNMLKGMPNLSVVGDQDGKGKGDQDGNQGGNPAEI